MRVSIFIRNHKVSEDDFINYPSKKLLTEKEFSSFFFVVFFPDNFSLTSA